MDAVTADLDRFARQLSALADQRITAESGGGHVTGTALRGQIVEVTADSRWATGARASEIESELTDMLTRLQRETALDELADGPKSTAIVELNTLISNPNALLRRVGLAS